MKSNNSNNHHTNLEIPLLPKHSSSSSDPPPHQNPPNPKSQFSNYFDASSSSSKYIQNVPFLRWITFLDMLPHMKRLNASQKDLESDDVPKLDKHFNVEAKIVALDHHWTLEQNKPNPSFSRTIILAFLPEILICVSLCFVDSTARICYSLFMGNIINLISSDTLKDDSQKQDLWSSAIMLCILVLISYGTLYWGFFLSYIGGGKLRLAITGLLYKKLNSISLTSLHEFQIGKVINLIANDLNDIDYGVIFIPTLLLCPYMMILGAGIMWGYFGYSSLIGLVACVVFLFAQMYVSGKTESPRGENKLLTDDRVKFTNEIIENIRLIKMYGWEKPFRENVERLREKEVNTFKRIVFYDVLGRNLSSVGAYSSILLICIAYIKLEDGILSSDKIYATMVILSFLSQTGLMYSHIGRMFLVNFGLIIKRIERIMNIAEVEVEGSVEERRKMKEQTGLIFKGFTAYWNKEAKAPCLKDINLTLKPGTLTTIIGKIGSGKTTLLLSVLKEIPVTQGKLELSGRVAFVEQEPIIFSGTFRENVLFGKEYNAELFNEVIKICSLDKDLALFPYKDLTMIGEKGVNLSGGQKARVSLARAIYSESDIYLLDDPFSAVDSKVARDMFENGLKGGILRDKTVILVTHHLHFAKESDYVVVMDHGKIQAKGTFAEIEHMDVDLLNIFNQNNSRKNSVASEEEEEILKKKKMSIYNNNDNEVQNAEEKIKEDSTSVSWSTYGRYLKVIGTYKELLLLACLFGGFQILTIYYTRYIGYWASQHSIWNEENDAEFDHSGYIMSAAIMLFMMYVLNYFKRMKYYEYILGTNSELHKRMMRKLTRAKVLFFDLNPIGRILNRFANDLGILDKPNIISSYDLIDGVLYSFSLLLTVCLINPSLFISSGVVIYLLTRMKKYFERPMVLSKKRELVSRSPIFSTVSSTLNGLMIIRVYNRGGKFIREFLDLIYENSKAVLFMHKTSFFFGIALDIGIRGIMIIGIMTFAYLVFYVEFESALIGLSLLFLLQIGEETSYVVKQTLSVDINMQSAQRMLEYCELPSEGKEKVEHTDQKVEEQFQGKWPLRGEMIFHDVYLRYREDLPCALNGLSFKVAGGTKVACVGRTGAGKSSIIQALFRMVEIEDGAGHYESYIKIDGVDIKEIGLNLLRKRLSIIPQAPVVFTGTIRRNLDPFELYQDGEIWSVLEEVSLKRMVMGLEKGLETDMTVSASVFSVGQKQLICLARAILMKSKVLILDEATANVDMETDEFIQRKIMEKFAECTVLTIAHRLITIANYDKVIVMDKGRMVEFDSPYELLVERVGDERITKKDGGVFVDMVKNTGNRMAKKIFKLAREKFYSKEKVE